MIFLQQSGRLIHSSVRQVFEWCFPKQLFKSQRKG
jgi:hypothetical protein